MGGSMWVPDLHRGVAPQKASAGVCLWWQRWQIWQQSGSWNCEAVWASQWFLIGGPSVWQRLPLYSWFGLFSGGWWAPEIFINWYKFYQYFVRLPIPISFVFGMVLFPCPLQWWYQHTLSSGDLLSSCFWAYGGICWAWFCLDST